MPYLKIQTNHTLSPDNTAEILRDGSRHDFYFYGNGRIYAATRKNYWAF